MDPTILRGGKIGDGGRLEGERFVSRGGEKGANQSGARIEFGDLPRDTLSAPTLDKKVAPPREGACPGWLEFLEF